MSDESNSSDDNPRRSANGMTDFLSELKTLKKDKELVKSAGRTMLFGKKKRGISPVTAVIIAILLLSGGFVIYISRQKKEIQKIEKERPNYAKYFQKANKLLTEGKYVEAREQFKNASGLAETDTKKGLTHFWRGKTYVLEMKALTGPEANDKKIRDYKKKALEQFRQAEINEFRGQEMYYYAILLLSQPPYPDGSAKSLLEYLNKTAATFGENNDPAKLNYEQIKQLYKMGELARGITKTEKVNKYITETHIRLATPVARKCFELVINAPVARIPRLSSLKLQELQEFQANARIYLSHLKKNTTQPSHE